MQGYGARGSGPIGDQDDEKGSRVRKRIGRAGSGLRRGAASLLSPTGLRGAAVEVTWVAAHAALYPLGVVTERAGARGARAA